MDIWRKVGTFPDRCIAQLASRIAAAGTPAGRSPAGPILDKPGKYLLLSPVSLAGRKGLGRGPRTRTVPCPYPLQTTLHALPATKKDRRTTEHAMPAPLHRRLSIPSSLKPIYIYSVVDARRAGMHPCYGPPRCRDPVLPVPVALAETVARSTTPTPPPPIHLIERYATRAMGGASDSPSATPQPAGQLPPEIMAMLGVGAAKPATPEAVVAPAT